MWFFAKRYLSWYVWLGVYGTAVGALIGVLCFSFPFLPFLILFFIPIYLAALAFAAPLNLVILPIAFHLARESPRRRDILRFTGVAGGLISPVFGAIGLWWIGATGPAPFFRFYPRLFDNFPEQLLSMAGFICVGAIAGFFCGRLFHKHGDKPSIFDINDAIESVRAHGLQGRHPSADANGSA